MNDTATTEIRTRRRPTQSRSVRALPPQNSRFVFVPVILLEVETAILRPEEEPDSSEDKSDTDETEEGEYRFVVYILGRSDARAWVGEGCSGKEILCACSEEGGFGGEIGEC